VVGTLIVLPIQDESRMEVLHWYTNLHVLQGASGSSPADAITCSNILRHCQHRYLFDLVLRALISNLNSAYYYII
jgi:hypothetical protein